MIIRVLTATVRDIRRSHPRVLREQLPILKGYDGLVYVKLARRLIGRSEEIILLEEWRDPAALHAWTGPHLDKPQLLPGTEDLIDDLKITHYEALDIDPFA